MKINSALIVYNKPLYELHILEQKHPHFVRLLKSGHFTTRNWKKVFDTHQQTLGGVQRTLQFLGIKTERVFRRKLKRIDRHDLIVTVGGDGTFLETSHYVKSGILLGVNAAPFDSTGALCRGRLDNFLSLLIDLIAGDLKPTTIHRLKIKVGRKILPHAVLNEVLLAHQSAAGTSRYLMKVGKQLERHKSSGVWIATATGSTAAIRSAGGTPLPPHHGGMQFAVREIFLEKGRKFKLLKGILPKGRKLIFYSEMRQGALYIDGREMVPLPYGERIEISADGPVLRAIL